MAIKKRAYLYEVLLRFDQNGLVGAHKKTIVEVLDKDQVVSSAVGTADPLAKEDIEAVLGPQVAQLIDQNVRLNAAKDAAEQALADSQEQARTDAAARTGEQAP